MGVKRKQHSAEFKARVAMAALSGEKTLAELSAEFGVHPTMISNWKQELVKRAGELFGRGSKAPAAEDAQKVIDVPRTIRRLVEGLAAIRICCEPRRICSRCSTPFSKSAGENTRCGRQDPTSVRAHRQPSRCVG